MRVRYSARTHVGQRREVNQDAYGADQPGAALLLVVCDGMGGHLAGEVASTLAVETIIGAFSPTTNPEDALRSAFAEANTRIYAQGHGTMGTTGVAALFLHNYLHVANVGDSRAYLVREGQITQISRDHSFVSDQVAAGLMTPDEARESHVRNIITRALGHTADVDVDVFTQALRPGDTVLLSSDGMHGLITDAEIAEIASMLPPDQAVHQLVDQANERGGIDNITVVIAQVDELDAAPSDVDADSDAGISTSTATSAPSAVAVTRPLQTHAASRRAAPVERPLSRLGLVLTALTLALLVGVGGLLWAAPAADYGAAPTAAPAASPTATSQPATAGPAPTAPASTEQDD